MEEKILRGLEVSSGAIPSMVITAAILLLLPIAYVALWKRRCGEAVSLKPLLIGAIGFLVSARVLELGVHMVCIVWDNPVSRFINGSTLAYVIYGTLMAGVFEECGRYVVIRFIMKKNKTRENMVMYGIGHGGIEVWGITLLLVLSLIAVDVVIQTNGIDYALHFLGVSTDSPENLLNSAVETIKTAANFDIATGALYVFERIFAMFAHISFTVIVAYGVIKAQKKYLPMAILAHAAVDVSAALLQRGVINIWTGEICFCVCVVLLMIRSRGLYRKMNNPDLA